VLERPPKDLETEDKPAKKDIDPVGSQRPRRVAATPATIAPAPVPAAVSAPQRKERKEKREKLAEVPLEVSPEEVLVQSPSVSFESYSKLKGKFQIMKEKYIRAKETVAEDKKSLTALVEASQKAKSDLSLAQARLIELENKAAALEERLEAASSDAQTAKAELKEVKAAKSVGQAVSPTTLSKKEEKLKQKKERLLLANQRLEKTSEALLRSNEQLVSSVHDLQSINARIQADKDRLEYELAKLRAVPLVLSDPVLSSASMPTTPLGSILSRAFGGALLLTKDSKDPDLIYLTCRNVNDHSRKIVFELTSVGGGLFQYCPTLMNGFGDDEDLPDFVVNDIFFKEKHLPIFLAKLVLEVGKEFAS